MWISWGLSPYWSEAYPHWKPYLASPHQKRLKGPPRSQVFPEVAGQPADRLIIQNLICLQTAGHSHSGGPTNLPNDLLIPGETAEGKR